MIQLSKLFGDGASKTLARSGSRDNYKTFHAGNWKFSGWMPCKVRNSKAILPYRVSIDAHEKQRADVAMRMAAEEKHMADDEIMPAAVEKQLTCIENGLTGH